ncbi:MAG: choice-of-anchor L domain-containing protein [Bacteroidota bacterium]
MTVNNVVTPATLVNTIAAGGIAVSNISYTGAQLANGIFLCTGNCNLGISGGILLTSGSSLIAAAPNTGTGQGIDVGLGGDTDLTTLTTGTTYDACVLEFDFIAVSDTAIFNYVFASDEYSDYVGTAFNDVFGFFISGPGILGKQNIALIPGTTMPVAINNVNNGFAMGIPTGPCENCAYFYDNVIDTFTTAYDGLTTVLTATAANIQPGQTYHLKLAIADVGDHVFDSGVFLEAGSFRIAGPPAMFVGGNRVSGNTVHICQGSSISLSVPAGFSYLWSTGETTQTISVNTAGTYNLTLRKIFKQT